MRRKQARTIIKWSLRVLFVPVLQPLWMFIILIDWLCGHDDHDDLGFWYWGHD